MQVSDLVNQYQANLSSGGEVSAKTKTKGVEQLVSTVSKLQKGQIFEGTVNSIRGNQVILGLSSGQNITARMDGSISLNVGESVFFQVKSNVDNTVQIKPVSVGSMNNPTLLTALDAAGMAVTEDNLNMVNTMMKEQMPIDAKSLGEMARKTASLPGANVSTVVIMTKHNLPITTEMVNQFENYKSNEGQLLKGVDELAKSVSTLLSSEEVSDEGAFGFHKELVSILSGEGEAHVVENQASKLEQMMGTPTLKVPSLNMGVDSPQNAPTQADTLKALVSKDGVLPGNSTVNGQEQYSGGLNVVMSEDETVPSSNAQNSTELLQNSENRILLPNYDSEEFNPGTVGRALSPEENGGLSLSLTRNPSFVAEHSNLFDENGMLRPEVSVKEVMQAVSDYFGAHPQSMSHIKDVVARAGYGKLAFEMIAQKLSIEPEELTMPHRLDDLYKEMDETVRRIAQSASSLTEKPDNAIVSSAGNIHDNLEFISQVNSLYTYVQIPLKLSGGETTGDLYVYRNKKQSRNDSDELTAFLHFDMEHLGSTDISVRMKNKNVNTKFYLEDEGSYELIMNNIHILKENLDNLGYNCVIDCENDSKPVNFVTDFLEKDKKTAENISRYSFDVRA